MPVRQSGRRKTKPIPPLPALPGIRSADEPVEMRSPAMEPTDRETVKKVKWQERTQVPCFKSM